MENHGTASIREFLRTYWTLVSPYKKRFYAAIFWILMLQIVALAEPYGVKIVVDRVQENGIGGLGDLAAILGILLAALTAGGVVLILRNWSALMTCFPVIRDIPKNAGRKLLALPLSFHERENTGLLMGKITKGMHKSDEITAMLLWETFPLGLQTIVTTAVIATYSLPAVGVFLLTLVVFLTLTYKIKVRMAPVRRKRYEDDGKADEMLGQSITNVATVQAFAQERRENGALKEVRDGIYDRMVEEFRFHVKFDFVRNMIVSLGRVTVLGVCAWAAMPGEMSMGTFVFVVALADKVFLGCYRFGAYFDRIQEASESVSRLVKVMETPEKIVDPPNPVDPPDFRGRIEFRDVTYLYDAKLAAEEDRPTRPALSDVNLEFAPGETIGIVGMSGSGKSTLVKLLLRIDDPTQGAIRIDGIDLRMMRRSDFRRQFGYVPQEVEIFDATIAENIAYGRPDAKPEEIVAAAKAADAHGFIERMRKGYETVVGNRGMRLSGGQRQRVGIARAILMNPRVLIFDEATSHVDTISEAKIMRALRELRKGRTTLIIAHRLSTVKNADRIVVLEEGRVRQTGTHRELLANEGLYAELIRRQREEDDAS